jgi:hypothetical protein
LDLTSGILKARRIAKLSADNVQGGKSILPPHPGGPSRVVMAAGHA